MTATATTPKIYVGTYAKYNSGSIAGEWLDLEDYSDASEFMAACAELHKDETDPEFMFQDYEGFPESFYGESLSLTELEKLFEFINMDEGDRMMVEMYQQATGNNFEDCDIDKVRESYSGTADSPADFAEQIAEDCGGIPKGFPSWIVIDWERSWECNLRHDFHTPVYNEDEGVYYFFRCI